MTRYPNNEQRGDQHIDRQPDLTDEIKPAFKTLRDAQEAAQNYADQWKVAIDIFTLPNGWFTLVAEDCDAPLCADPVDCRWPLKQGTQYLYRVDA